MQFVRENTIKKQYFYQKVLLLIIIFYFKRRGLEFTSSFAIFVRHRINRYANKNRKRALIARGFMTKYDEDNSKRFIIFAMIPVGWLFIYDLITVINYISSVLNLTALGIDFLFQELFTIVNLFTLYFINKDLRKADNPEKYRESTDWFYESLEEKK